MIEIIYVKYMNKYKYIKTEVKVSKGMLITVNEGGIVHTATVIEGNKMVNEGKIFVEDITFVKILEDKDFTTIERNTVDSLKAITKCNQLISNKKMSMTIVNSEFSFDKKVLYYYFIADSRIDFRELVKELAYIYKVRIELRQIGVRDKAALISGIGPCGRLLCCSTFLRDFSTVSIAMAKNQNISLNPSKINGSCGRLLCCLSYEDEQYTHYKNNLPSNGEIVNTSFGTGKVVSVDIYKRKYKVQIGDVVEEIDAGNL